MSKKIPQRKKSKTEKKIIRRIFWKKGKVEVPILISIIVFGIALGGGLLFSFNDSTLTTSSQITPPLCCDSGNGPNCVPLTDPQHPILTYNNAQYGLLKSDIKLAEGEYHVEDSGVRFGPNHDPVIINTTDGYRRSDGLQECGKGVNDQIWNLPGKTPECVAIPNDEIVYVCRANCHPTTCTGPGVNSTVFCYGDMNTKYDAYFRLADVQNPGIPDPIKNCFVVGQITPKPTPQMSITIGPYNSHQSLQLHDFTFVIPTIDQSVDTIVSPFCKPAIYLYPPKEESVAVNIAPKGDLKITIPPYPASGWHVIADPNGTIHYGNSVYDYLFYEAGIPDSLISLPDSGYIIEYKDLSSFFNNLLPKLGLNQKEQQQFSDYWLKALPKNTPYYRISVIPQQTLNSISPLTINPKPDSIIRVTLYFQPIDKKINIPEPLLPNINRNGFTVVEWGGLFKQDTKHPFTCLM